LERERKKREEEIKRREEERKKRHMEKEQQRLDMEAKRGHKEHGKDRDKRQVWVFYLLGIAALNVKLRGSWLTTAGL